MEVFVSNDALECMMNDEIEGKFAPSAVKSLTAYDEYNVGHFTWRHLYHKLCFEQMLENFLHTLDFKLFYRFLTEIGSEIQVLRIPALDKTKLKSNHYWLMTLLGRLPNLRSVKFHRGKQTVTPDFYKFMSKGMSYMKKEGRDLKQLVFDRDMLGRAHENFYSVLKFHPNLMSLKCNNTILSIEEAKAIGKVLADFKFIKELDVSKANLDLNTSKEIADGLMRAK